MTLTWCKNHLTLIVVAIYYFQNTSSLWQYVSVENFCKDAKEIMQKKLKYWNNFTFDSVLIDMICKITKTDFNKIDFLIFFFFANYNVRDNSNVFNSLIFFWHILQYVSSCVVIIWIVKFDNCKLIAIDWLKLMRKYVLSP